MYFNFEKYYNKRIPKDAIFFDVGANKGDWSFKIKKKYSNAKFYCFEPIPKITKKFKNQILYNVAVDKKSSKKNNFFITKENVTSSLLLQNRSIINKFITFEDSKGLIHRKSDYNIVKEISVETVRLDQIIRQTKIQEIHYLKIDAEGNDLNVLQSLGSSINKVWGFELETWNSKNTLWKNQKWLGKCIKYIKSKKFVIAEKFVHGKGLSTDLLCVRKDLFKR